MPDDTEIMGAERSGTTSAAAPIALEEPINPDTYICGAGDVFELNFWGQQNFRLRIASDMEGRAFISKVGFVSVAGKTLTAVRELVGKKVRRVYPGLMVALALVKPRSFLVHVVENVKQPGSYRAHPYERVAAVLARSGGVTGSRRLIKIHRKSGDIIADLVMYELTGDTTYNPYVLDGDVISVPFADVSVEITGAVRRPGTYELVKSKDLAELLDLAGGFTSSVARSLPIQIIRRNSQQRASFTSVPFTGDETPNYALIDDDHVNVRSTEELQRTVLLIGAVVGADPLDQATTTKRLPFVEGDTVLSLIERAGGIKAPGDLRRSYIARPRANGSPELIPVDLEALLVAREFRADRPVKLGDTIVVPPMKYGVLVEGAVGHAGLYNYNPSFGIREYIARAGGRSRIAMSLDEVKLIDADGRMHPFRASLRPSPGDAILVPERSITRGEIVQLVIAGAGLVLSGVAVTIAATR